VTSADCGPGTEWGLAWPGLPRPTTTRLLLLVLLLAAGSAFAAFFWLVLEPGSWHGAFRPCLHPPASVSPAAAVSDFNGCVDRVELLQGLTGLVGPVILLAASAVVFAVAVPVRLRVMRARPAPPSLAWRFSRCVACFRLRGRPQIVMAPRIGPQDALCIGGFRRYRVIVGRDLSPLAERDQSSAEQVDAILCHELAHLEARDVDRTWLTLSAAGMFALIVAAPLAVAAARRLDSTGFALGWRLAALLAISVLATLAVLRVREHEADVRAATTRLGGPGMTALLEGWGKQQPQSSRRGRGEGRVPLPGVPEFLRAHPSPRLRLAVLRDPRRLWRLSVVEFLVAGIVTGAVFDELAVLIEYLTPDNDQVAYWLAGALVGLMASGIVVPAIWRDTAARFGATIGRAWPRTVAAGAVLGLGIMLGSQIALRAAADWNLVFPTALSLATTVSLTHADPRAVIALTGAAIAGGVVFTGWAAVIARSVIARSAAVARRRTLTSWCLAAAGFGGLVAAVPLGQWYLLCRDVAAGLPGAALTDQLRATQLRLALALTVAAALAALAVAGRAGLRWRWAVPVAVVVAAVLVASPALVASEISAHTAIQPIEIQPGSTASGQLPFLPPQATEGTGLVPTELACLYLSQVTPSIFTARHGLRQLADLFVRTPDAVLEAIGDLLRQQEEATKADRDAVAEDDNAITAMLARCDLMFATTSLT
jgi:Zn-dependent protease with chaperone function